MKKRLIVFVGLLLIFSHGIAFGMVQWNILSSIKFVRAKGKPVPETFTLSALGGQATLKLTIERVSSAMVSLNGEVVFRPSEFNRKVEYLESEVFLLEGKNALEVLLKSKPGSSITVQIVQQVEDLTADMGRIGIANSLRAGDVEGALKGFAADEKRQQIISSLNAEQRIAFANQIESAKFLSETGLLKWYRYHWTDEKFSDFAMTKDEQGHWIITSW